MNEIPPYRRALPTQSPDNTPHGAGQSIVNPKTQSVLRHNAIGTASDTIYIRSINTEKLVVVALTYRAAVRLVVQPVNKNLPAVKAPAELLSLSSRCVSGASL